MPIHTASERKKSASAKRGGKAKKRVAKKGTRVPKKGKRVKASHGGTSGGIFQGGLFSPPNTGGSDRFNQGEFFNQVGKLNANTGTLDNIVKDLRGFEAGGAGQVNELRNFQPLSGIGQGTLNELLSTGLPTDTEGLTQAAQIRAGQEFDDFQDRLGERLSALGLTSSSAQTAATGRERGRLAERISATGLEAGVNAAEAASGRRQRAVDQDLGVGGQRLSGLGQSLQGALGRSGQRLGALGQAAGGAGQSAGFDLRAQEGNQRSALQGLFGRGGNDLGGGGGGGRRGGGGGFFAGSTGVASRPARGRTSRPSGRGRGFGAGGLGFGAKGGKTSNPAVPENLAMNELLQDPRFISFLKNQGADLSRGFGAQIVPPGAGDGKALVNLGLANLGGVESARELFDDPSKRAKLRTQGADQLRELLDTTPQTIGPSTNAAAAGLGFGVSRANTPGNVDFVGGDPGISPAGGGRDLLAEAEGRSQGRQRESELFDESRRASVIPRESPPNRGPEAPPQTASNSAVDVDALIRGLVGQNDPSHAGPQKSVSAFDSGNIRDGSLGPTGGPPPRSRRVAPGAGFAADGGRTEGGGEVPGVDDGSDKIPAMLRSEELVVTPEITAAVENADPNVPNPEIIAALQALAQQPLEFSDDEGEFVGQGGGAVPQPNLLEEIGITVPGILDGRRKLFAHGGSTGGGADNDVLSRILAAAGLSPRNPDDPRDQPQFVQNAQLQTGIEGVDIGRGGFTDAGQAKGPSPEDVNIARAGRNDDPFGLNASGGHRDLAGGIPSFARPDPVDSGSFKESTGRLGERKFELTGGDPGTSAIPEGALKGGGNVGSVGLIRDEFTGQPIRDRFRTSPLEDALHRKSLIDSALATDPVGGPEKAFRMQQASQSAERDVAIALDAETVKVKSEIGRQQARSQQISAEADLNASFADRLRGEASLATAQGELAKQVLEASNNDPELTKILNIFKTFKDTDDAGFQEFMAGAGEAVIRQFFTSRGVELEENGSIAQFFGAPSVEISPSQQGPDNRSAVEEQQLNELTQSITSEELAAMMGLSGGQ